MNAIATNIDTQIKLEQLTWHAACERNDVRSMLRASKRLENLERVRRAVTAARANMKGVKR